MRNTKIKREKINKDVAFANAAGYIGCILYALMRMKEALSGFVDMRISLFKLALTCGLLLVLIILHLILKNNKFVPLVTGTLTLAMFIVGAILSKEFEYYFVAMLCIFGIVCLYQRFNMVITYFFVCLISNIPLYIYVFPNADYVNISTMFIEGALYVYGTFFLVMLSWRSTKGESIADKGLKSFSSLLASTPNYTVIIDDLKIVRYISDSMANFADIKAELAVGRPLLDLLENDNVRMMFADIIDADGFFEDVREIDIKDKAHYFKIICDQLHGAVGGMYIDISDITATVEAKNAAEKAEHEAKLANDSKSKFLATMSHEIRTPMNAIIGIAQMELTGGSLTDKQRSSMNKIYSSGNTLLSIINDILDLSKIETGKMELIPIDYDVPSLINDSVQLNLTKIGSKQIDFILNVDENVPVRLFGDELRLKQILNNILSNAFKYTDKGSVTLSVSCEPQDDGFMLIFNVTDTGQGMTPEQVKQLFDEYSRFNAEANRTIEGTGLGMSITRKLTKLMDGKIDIKSEYGKGSVFTASVKQGKINGDIIGSELANKLRNFTFTAEKQDKKLQILRTKMPYGKVLVVDDVETNLFVAEGLMVPYGLKIELAGSGFIALDKVRAGKTYDIIFMDHMMPRMDGIESTKKIREAGYTGTIVALTANAVAGNDKMFKANGFDDFISKPIDLRQLNAALNKYVRDAHKEETKAAAEPPDTVKTKTESPPINPKILAAFKRDAQSAINVLAETRDNGDLLLFTTTAHAMKSALANIGEKEKSALAEKLENAGRGGDKAFIAENSSQLIEMLKSLLAKEETNDINHLVGKEDAANADNINDTIIEDTELLQEQLQKIISACENYDDTAAISAADLLLEKQWKTYIIEKLEEIKTAVFSDSDFDKALEIAKELRKM